MSQIKGVATTDSPILIQIAYEGQQVRYIIRDGEPWFVARDVCEILDISDPKSSVRLLDDDEKGVHSMHTPGGIQEVLVVNEAGLYSLVLRSRKPEAKAFKRWITHEVLPSIRRNGMYVTEALLDDPEHLLRVTQRLVEERRARLEAEAKVRELAPKAEFHDRVAASGDAQSIRDVAKVLGTGQNRLFAWLRGQRILMADNTPYQEYLDAGYFRLIQQVWRDRQGEEHLYTKTLVTGKGMTWLQKRWDRDNPKRGPLQVV